MGETLLPRCPHTIRFTREAATHRLSVAETGSVIVGFTYAGPGGDPLSREPHKIHVAPPAKGTGIGKALMVAALAGFRSTGAQRAHLWVVEGNDQAIGFYERGGWSREETSREQPIGTAPTRQWRYRYDLRQG